MITTEERQSILDQEHLRLLSIGYYIIGGVYALFSLFPLIYVAIGLFVMSGWTGFPASQSGSGPDPRFVGVVIALFGMLFTIGFALLGGFQLYAGRLLRRRQSRVLCFVVAGFTCLCIPFGTALGVMTFLALRRPSVVVLFNSTGPDPASLR